MIPNWLYNRIKKITSEEISTVKLDSILKSVGTTTAAIQLLPSHPAAVSIKTQPEFYIQPSLKAIDTPDTAQIIIFSAPGATGKSALARFISREHRALHWDLSKERIANYSFSGMLIRSVGADYYSRFTKGLKDSKAVLVLDALDEADMISGRSAIETLLTDVRDVCKGSKAPNVVLCARTEIAHFAKEFYSQPDTYLPVAHYEIDFFNEEDAVRFLEAKIAESLCVTPVTSDWVKTQFAVIKERLGGNEEVIRSFLGYAPVLEALAVFFADEPNTMKLLNDVGDTKSSIAVFSRIMEHILQREHQKVVNGFKERCKKKTTTFQDWDCVYTVEEQISRIADYLIFDTVEYDSYKLDLPNELVEDYNEVLCSFLQTHPFIRVSTVDKTIVTDFAGPAFRDYTLARLLNIGAYEDYLQEYLSSRYHSQHCSSKLLFDFYSYFAGGKTKYSHFPYLYDSHKARELVNMFSSVSVEEVEEETTFTFTQHTIDGDVNAIEFVAMEAGADILISQLSNSYIDISGSVVFGRGVEDVLVSNSTIKCGKILLNSANVMIVAQDPGNTILAAVDGFTSSAGVRPQFELRVDKPDNLRVTSPNIDEWYKLRPHRHDLDSTDDVDTTKFENAVKTILKYFRKDKKDTPGKHYEFIKNRIVGKSVLKNQVLDFLMHEGIIYQDHKDPKQYKLNMERLETFGVNWGHISQSSIPDFKELFAEYNAWCTSSH